MTAHLLPNKTEILEDCRTRDHSPQPSQSDNHTRATSNCQAGKPLPQLPSAYDCRWRPPCPRPKAARYMHLSQVAPSQDSKMSYTLSFHFRGTVFFLAKLALLQRLSFRIRISSTLPLLAEVSKGVQTTKVPHHAKCSPRPQFPHTLSSPWLCEMRSSCVNRHRTTEAQDSQQHQSCEVL